MAVRAVPPWKQALLERKKEESKEGWSRLPQWKKDLIQRKHQQRNSSVFVKDQSPQDAPTTPVDTEEEVTYGVGFVHRLLQKFSHMSSDTDAPRGSREGITSPRLSRDGMSSPRSPKDGSHSPRIWKDGSLSPTKDGSMSPRGSKDGGMSPRGMTSPRIYREVVTPPLGFKDNLHSPVRFKFDSASNYEMSSDKERVFLPDHGVPLSGQMSDNSEFRRSIHSTNEDATAEDEHVATVAAAKSLFEGIISSTVTVKPSIHSVKPPKPVVHSLIAVDVIKETSDDRAEDTTSKKQHDGLQQDSLPNSGDTLNQKTLLQSAESLNHDVSVRGAESNGVIKRDNQLAKFPSVTSRSTTHRPGNIEFRHSDHRSSEHRSTGQRPNSLDHWPPSGKLPTENSFKYQTLSADHVSSLSQNKIASNTDTATHPPVAKKFPSPPPPPVLKDKPSSQVFKAETVVEKPQKPDALKSNKKPAPGVPVTVPNGLTNNGKAVTTNGPIITNGTNVSSETTVVRKPASSLRPSSNTLPLPPGPNSSRKMFKKATAGPGDLVIRPASSLTPGATLTPRYNDIRTGSFAPATKRPSYYSDSDEEEDVVDNECIVFINAEVKLDRSLLEKTHKGLKVSRIFSQEKVKLLA